MATMLGLVDFFRAVHGTVRLALRRVHPLAGPVVVALVWVLALGSLLWVTREDDGGSPSNGAAAGTEREGDGTRSVDRDDGGGDGSGDDAGGPDGVGQVEWAEGDGSPEDGVAAGEGADGDDAGGTADGGDDDDPTLESPGGPGRVTPPSSTGSPPSWDPQEPEEPGPGGPGSTTSSTTPPPTSGPGTSTTVPPSGGGLLDVLLGVLFP